MPFTFFLSEWKNDMLGTEMHAAALERVEKARHKSLQGI
jgi:hypothetical protein